MPNANRFLAIFSIDDPPKLSLKLLDFLQDIVVKIANSRLLIVVLADVQHQRLMMCPFYSRKKQCTYSAEVFDFGAVGALSWENDYLVSSQRREQRPANHHRLRD